jgi:Putative diphthamide synthesis protein
VRYLLPHTPARTPALPPSLCPSSNAFIFLKLELASYLPLITHIRELVSRKRKKSYTISVGKLNPAKLANFMEIECFVLVACPENSIVEAKASIVILSYPHRESDLVPPR